MKLLFVCTGNICRSPMAERVAQQQATEAGLDIDVTSAATTAEEVGQPMYPTAAAVLSEHGYDASGHVARQVTASELDAADLVVVAEEHHKRAVLRLQPDANVRLLMSFVPGAPDGAGLPDPWALPAAAFEQTLADIESATPGILAEIQRLEADQRP